MELIVYTAPWCSDCRKAKRFLARHKIPFREIDVEFTPAAAEEVIRQTGKRAIPQFVIERIFAVGPETAITVNSLADMAPADPYGRFKYRPLGFRYHLLSWWLGKHKVKNTQKPSRSHIGGS